MSIDASFADIASMLSELPESASAAPQKEPEQPGGLFSYLSGVGGAALWGWARYWNNTGLGLVDTVNLVSGAYGRYEKRRGKAVRDMEFFRNAYLNSIRGELALVPEENQAKRRLLERKLAAVQSIYDARIREEKEAPTLLEIHRQFYSDINQDIDRRLEEARQKYHTGKTLEEQWREGSWGISSPNPSRLRLIILRFPGSRSLSAICSADRLFPWARWFPPRWGTGSIRFRNLAGARRG
ncbi:MAG: hypothetical protein L6W00_28810 [Lentisphaeria bacterium]|nr:MAG: hypothetical protein L6W00_28810 [Lentisphaeria bacterium]